MIRLSALRAAAVALALSLALPALAAPARRSLRLAEAKVQAHKLADAKVFRQHLDQHIKYPATRAQILAACNNEVDLDAADKKWLDQSLPDRTYASADEVVKAVGL